MRTARECIAKAEQMERFAAREDGVRMMEEWLAMACYWRGLAHQATWQDRYTGPRI